MTPDAAATPSIEALVDACAVPAALVDVDGRVVAANAAFAERFGVRDGDSLGVLDARLVDVGLRAGDAPLALPGHPDGQLHLRPAAGQWLAQWLPAVDTTAEQRQLQMFADTVAHDLRSPLRSIESFAKLLEDRAGAKLDASERMHLSRIRAAATRMSGLLAALGELSRAASASMTVAPVDVSLLAEWVLAELQDAEPSREVEVDVQPGLMANGDERLLKQLLRALLENAWTFTRGLERPRIAVRGERVGDRLRVAVQDNGRGFDMQYAHKLFQPFQRLHGVAEGAGHGLGLAIAQRIAQRHGGDVSPASIEGQGSTFTLELPAAES
ncbi:ATP-binding protein [Cognatilysobacter segetis]|uniref:ATP-binding protein n=1 Tax=Cognatilysobacter segetis TaxID=2492394 RepID=UPI00105D3718|nr:ATP-binding protein [Lysobacter segetis]